MGEGAFVGRGIMDKVAFALGFDGQAGVCQAEERAFHAQVSTRERAQRSEISWRTQETSEPTTGVEGQ